jgi:hypothetical protein
VCYLIYTAINTIIIDIQALFTASSYTFTVDTLTSADPGAAFVSLLMAVVFYLISCVAWIVSMFVAYARAIQIYVMTAFSPLPYALLGFDETRSWGVGYIKMFLSLCFAGAIMIILLFVYPMILAGIFGAGSSGAIAINGAEAFDILKLLVVSILLIISLAKSGAWARDIFGG